jgi:hypothetical protein
MLNSKSIIYNVTDAQITDVSVRRIGFPGHD